MSNTKSGAISRKQRIVKRENLELSSLPGPSSANMSVFTSGSRTAQKKVGQSNRRQNTNSEFQYCSTPFAVPIPFSNLDTSAVPNLKNIKQKKKLDQTLKKRHNKCDEKLMEAEIDLYYAQYLQMKYLECQTKKAHESRAKCAMEKIEKVWQLVQLSMHKNYAVQKDMNILIFLIHLHAHLKKQNEILEPFLESIPSFQKQYINIAKAVENVKHKLLVKDIELSETGCEDEIIQLLQNIYSFLSEFLNNLKNFSKITATSDILHLFESDSEHITENIRKCSTLLTEAKDLLLTETSYSLGLQSSAA